MEFNPVKTSESYKERCIFINVHAFMFARVGSFSSTCISVVETVSTAILIYCITKVTMRVMETHPLLGRVLFFRKGLKMWLQLIKV